MSKSKRQEEQQKLRHALGTVIGFRGYLHNLETTVKRCTQKEAMLFAFYFLEKDVNALRYQLKITEDCIRLQLKNLDKVWP